MYPRLFLKTFIDLLLRPRKVYEQRINYLNPLKFTLSLGTTTFFFVKLFNLDKFNYTDIPDYQVIALTSQRLRDYFELENDFESTYKFQVGILMILITLIPIFLILFKKARIEFKEFFSSMIYSIGMLIFLSYLLMAIFNILNLPVKTFVTVSAIPLTAYLIYSWVALFGNKLSVYLKIFSLLLIGEILTPGRMNFLNIYISIFKPQTILHSSIKSEKWINAKLDSFKRFDSSIKLNDTASLITSHKGSLFNLDLIGRKSSTKILENSSDVLFYFIQADTIRSYRFINEAEGKLEAKNLWPSSNSKTDTLIIEMSFIANAESLTTKQDIFLGRDSLWQPTLTIYDKSLKNKNTLTFNNPELNNQTFDRSFTISDSIAILTSYKLYDNVSNSPIITAYWCHIFNFKQGKIIHSRVVFERTGQYGLEEMPEIEITPTHTLIVSFTIANNLSHELCITSINPIDLSVMWKANLPIINDRIDRDIRIKYFNNKIYFLGNASLFIHKHWFEKEVTFSFLGAIMLDGTNPEIKYFRESRNYYSHLRGFYEVGDDLYFTGFEVDNYIRLFTILFPTNHSFSCKVSDNFP